MLVLLYEYERTCSFSMFRLLSLVKTNEYCSFSEGACARCGAPFARCSFKEKKRKSGLRVAFVCGASQFCFFCGGAYVHTYTLLLYIRGLPYNLSAHLTL